MSSDSVSLAINVLRSTLDYIEQEPGFSQTADAVLEYKLATTRLIAHIATEAFVPVVEGISPNP